MMSYLSYSAARWGAYRVPVVDGADAGIGIVLIVQLKGVSPVIGARQLHVLYPGCIQQLRQEAAGVYGEAVADKENLVRAAVQGLLNVQPCPCVAFFQLRCSHSLVFRIRFRIGIRVRIRFRIGLRIHLRMRLVRRSA